MESEKLSKWKKYIDSASHYISLSDEQFQFLASMYRWNPESKNPWSEFRGSFTLRQIFEYLI